MNKGEKKGIRDFIAKAGCLVTITAFIFVITDFILPEVPTKIGTYALFILLVALAIFMLSGKVPKKTKGEKTWLDDDDDNDDDDNLNDGGITTYLKN